MAIVGKDTKVEDSLVGPPNGPTKCAQAGCFSSKQK